YRMPRSPPCGPAGAATGNAGRDGSRRRRRRAGPRPAARGWTGWGAVSDLGGECTRTEPAPDALLLAAIPHLLRRRLRGLLVVAAGPPARLVAAGRELIPLCELEPLAGAGGLRVVVRRLPAGARHGPVPGAAAPQAAAVAQHRAQSRPALLV